MNSSNESQKVFLGKRFPPKYLQEIILVDGIEEGSLELTLENYRSSISHLEESSEETSIDTLLTNYLQAENDNYTLFSFISGLNNEVIKQTISRSVCIYLYVCRSPLFLRT